MSKVLLLVWTLFSPCANFRSASRPNAAFGSATSAARRDAAAALLRISVILRWRAHPAWWLVPQAARERKVQTDPSALDALNLTDQDTVRRVMSDAFSASVTVLRRQRLGLFGDFVQVRLVRVLHI
jgi:hypothetical protein